jgi:hypothetical protein
MQLKLRQTARFKTDTGMYLVIKETLYSFTPQQVKPIKTVPPYGLLSYYYLK